MNRVNAKKLTLDADLVLVHDVEPASLVTHRTDGRWVWRCHFDCSAARPAAWSFFRRFADQYDAAVFSLPGFECRLGIPMYVIQPSIDPLSEKNRELSPREVADILAALRVVPDKPLLVQIGPFTPGYDPIGVVNAYRLVEKHHDVRLVLAGMADDEPERVEIRDELLQAAREDPDVVVLELPAEAERQLEGASPCEIALGVLTYNNATTVPTVVEVVRTGLERHFAGVPAVLINADAGSSDATPDLLAAAGLPLVRARHETPLAQRIAVPFHGVPGRGAALRLTCAVARRLGAGALLPPESDGTTAR